MKISNILASFLLTIMSFVSLPSKAADALCGYLADPPEYPNPTVLHLFDWTITDASLYPGVRTQTNVLPPPSVTIGNNPAIDNYTVFQYPGYEFSHGILPTPVPSGVYTLNGTSRMSGQWCVFGSCIPSNHPGNNFTCTALIVAP